MPETFIAIQETPLDEAKAIHFLHDVRAGALDVFIGTTRQFTGEQETTTLFYECYEPMALSEMNKLITRASEKWELWRVVMLHRIGEVPLGESSVVIGVATAHRADAFAACRFLIDTLKQDVPIWKKEHFANGETEWLMPVDQDSM